MSVGTPRVADRPFGRSSFVSLCIFFAACCVLLASPVTAAQNRNVLVLFSNNRLLPANVEVDRGLRETLAAPAGRSVELFVEFLDHPAFLGADYDRTIASYLRAKYLGRPPEVIVLGSHTALAFFLAHRAELFPDAPAVHVGVSEAFLRSVQPLPANVVGVPAMYDYAGTLALALRLHPDTRRLVVVTGASSQDREREANIREVLGGMGPHPPVEFLAGLSTQAVLKRLAGLGHGDVVFTQGYFRDGEDHAFTPHESVELMAAASGAPIYGPYSTFIGAGIVGGRMPSFIDMGRQAGKVIGERFDATGPVALRSPAVTPALVHVDWRQVLKWDIRTESIPPDAVVHFRKPSFWETNRSNAIVILTVILIQAALIVALLVERRLRRRTASALEESERHMNLAARAAGLSVWSWDVARDQVSTLAKLRRSARSTEHQPIRLAQVLDTVHPADREGVASAARQAAEASGDIDIEYRSLQPDGKSRWIAARGRATNGTGKHLTGVTIDITARKSAELQAEKDRAALTHMTRVATMGQLSASIAHQLNQPLAAILGNAETARKMLSREEIDLEELRDICDDIVSEDIRAAEVIRRLSALYKRGEMRMTPLNLNELVLETLELVRTELLTRHVVPLTELSPSLPVIDGGRIELQQVLLNLVLNAADAMSGVAERDRQLTIRTGLDADTVRLCVIDKGTGIAEEDIKNVFEPFWSTKADGTGVGLAICQSIIKAHGGTLSVANHPGGGAVFCVRWPVRQDRCAEVAHGQRLSH